MAWIALIFYWIDSIYQWLTSGFTGWQRGEGGEVFINMFCVPGFETHPLRVFFSELNSVGTKNEVYLTLLITHQKTSQVTKNLRKNRHAKHWSSSKQNSQATKRWKISRCSWKNWMANVIRFAIKTIQGTVFWKIWGYFWPSFSTNKYRFTTEAI